MAYAHQLGSEKCRCCAAKKDVWKQYLRIQTHGCAACLNVLSERRWKPKTIENHRRKCRDLVCPRCTLRGYTPDRYESFQCTLCLEMFGFHQFLHSDFSKQRVKREMHPDYVCTNCRPKLRCSKCGEGYDDSYWPKHQRKEHLRLQTRLVCKPCRSQGFHAKDIVSYTCHSCKGKFGSRKFSRASLAKSWKNNGMTLKCIQCLAARQKTTSTSAFTTGTANGGTATV